MTVEAPTQPSSTPSAKPVEERENITIRFAGDSGDGMQQTGMQFTNTSAIFGNDVSTLPEFPAEIRAPAGTVYGVSSFQVHFSSEDIHTPGDELDALVVMNPAALRVHIADLKEGGILLANTDGFTGPNLKMAGYEENPLEDGSLDKYRLFQIPVTTHNRKALDEIEGLSRREVDRCKNYYALGIVCWLFNRPTNPVIDFLKAKFAKKPIFIESNKQTLMAGYNFGDTAELFDMSYRVRPAKLAPGTYREIGGNEALAYGLVAAGVLADKPVFYASYPITPASDILHELSKHKNFDVRTFQAEDEIAAMASLVGASFAGSIAITGTSGPGLALKGEALALGMMTELPMVIVNVQRGGPSTGLPTKTEASDLLQAMYGRNGECPVAIVAPSTPSECFDIAIEAVRIAIRHMVPVILLSDGYLANGAEPWKIPDFSTYGPIETEHPTEVNSDEGYLPYKRNADLARPWALPGTPGLMHRLGGLEKAVDTGNVSYDPENHMEMTRLRQAKIDKIADHIPPLVVHGDEDADLLLFGWGSTKGAIIQSVNKAQAKGLKVARAHLNHLNPFPKNTEEVLKRYKHVLIPELNMGQLRFLVRSRFMVDAIGLNKVKGRPFTVTEMLAKIEEILGN